MSTVDSEDIKDDSLGEIDNVVTDNARDNANEFNVAELFNDLWAFCGNNSIVFVVSRDVSVKCDVNVILGENVKSSKICCVMNVDDFALAVTDAKME